MKRETGRNESTFKALDLVDKLSRDKSGHRLPNRNQFQVYPTPDGRSAIVFHRDNEIVQAYSVGPNGDYCRAEIK